MRIKRSMAMVVVMERDDIVAMKALVRLICLVRCVTVSCVY